MSFFLGLLAVTMCATVPAMAQIGYGSAGSGLSSSLQGISSGYGYGYNNAVGMSGLGSSAGAGTYLAPLGYGIGGYGGYGGLGYGGYGGYGGLGYGGYGGGYGGYPAGYYGGAGLNGGYGANTAGSAGGAGWGSGSGTSAVAVPVVQAAVIPTTGTVAAAPLSAYGRSDDAVIPQPNQLQQQGNFAQNPTQTNPGFNSQAASPAGNSNFNGVSSSVNGNSQLQQG